MRTYGSIWWLLSAFNAIAAGLALGHAMPFTPYPAATALFCVSLSVAYAWTGWGLRRLDPRAYGPAIALAVIGMTAFPFGTAVCGYGLFILLSRRGEYVLSRSYGRIVQLTPHLRYRSSRALGWALALCLGLACSCAVAYVFT